MRAGEPSEYAAVTEYLFGLKPRGRKLGIDRMRPFAAALGHPERAIPKVHVAGTNGKGSVSAMIEAILRAAGWRVGLYTSPHLVNLGERVQVNRQGLTPEEIVGLTRELDPVADRVAAEGDAADRPSFFEFLTAMAWLQFKRKACDIAVLEVGLGGEFDATNLVVPEVSVITSIGIDHAEWLGGTIEQIAAAKAGIIKEGRPLVMGRVPAAAEAVIRSVAMARHAPVLSVRQEFGDTIGTYPQTGLAGDYQRWNAATATLAARQLGARWRISEPVMAAALRRVEWPGRWQRVQVDRRVMILDASHNAEGAEVLETNLTALVAETGRRPVVIFGALGTERARPLLASICRHASEIQLVAPRDPRASSHDELAALVPADFEGKIVRATIGELFPGGARCMAGGPNDVVVVTGSIYLLGEVMTRLADKSASPG